MRGVSEHQPVDASSSEPAGESSPGDSSIDLAAIERDLDAVQAALGRLEDGSYWTDEVTGEPLPAELLAADPLARRA